MSFCTSLPELKMTIPDSLLLIKFHVPTMRAGVVSRPRLTEKLLTGVNCLSSLTLLSGPAGSGKTTLLAEFVARLGRPVA